MNDILAYLIKKDYFCYLIRQQFMPTIKIIDSIKIDVYSREHPPPHFHVIYAEYEELIEIESLQTYMGYIPKPQRKKVLGWAENKIDLLMRIFGQLNPKL